MSISADDTIVGGEESNLSSAESIDSTALGNNENTMDADTATENSQPSSNITATPRTVRPLSDDTRHIQVEAKDVIEYEWPHKSGEKWFIQEQIGELLDIKSFSRKFPDLSRRKVEKHERDWLSETFDIHNIMNETQLRDLCAMRALEIHDLMAAEYPTVHQEYQKVTAERLKAQMVAQAKEMEAIANDSKRLAELRQKAIKSASEYNHELQATKAQERRHYWDIQTNIVQSSSNRWKKLPAKYTRVGPYPVAVILGQYQSYYKRFTPDEMRKLPLSTAIDSQDLYPVHREPSPQPITVTDREIERFEKIAAAQQTGTPIKMETPKSESVRKSYKNVANDAGPCSICEEVIKPSHTSLRCASCTFRAHPICAEMSEEMVPVVLTYDWHCIDCKKCTICRRSTQEDAIMFCDRCDRGYHTFCVGLKAAPKGEWVCETYCKIDLKKIATPSRAGLRRAVAH